MACNVTVNVLEAPDTGVLCWIDLVLNSGTSTSNGCAPLVTPMRVPDLSMLIGAIMPMLPPLA